MMMMLICITVGGADPRGGRKMLQAALAASSSSSSLQAPYPLLSGISTPARGLAAGVKLNGAQADWPAMLSSVFGS